MFLRRLIVSAGDVGRVQKVFSEVGNLFEEECIVSHSDVIIEDEVLMDLTHVSDLRDHGQVELPGEETDG